MTGITELNQVFYQLGQSIPGLGHVLACFHTTIWVIAGIGMAVMLYMQFQMAKQEG